MQWLAAGIVIVGLISVVLGLLLGAREILRTEQDRAHLQSAWEDALTKVLGDLLKAPRDRSFFIGGIALVILGVLVLIAK